FLCEAFLPSLCFVFYALLYRAVCCSICLMHSRHLVVSLIKSRSFAIMIDDEHNERATAKWRTSEVKVKHGTTAARYSGHCPFLGRLARAHERTAICRFAGWLTLSPF